MSINSRGRLTSINEKLRLNFESSPLCMSNKGKASLASESDCKSSGSNSGVCNAPVLILLKRGSNELVEKDAEDNIFHLVRFSWSCSIVVSSSASNIDISYVFAKCLHKLLFLV